MAPAGALASPVAISSGSVLRSAQQSTNVNQGRAAMATVGSRASSLCGKALREGVPGENSKSASTRRRSKSVQVKATAEIFIKERQRRRSGKTDANSIEVKGKLTIAKKTKALDLVDIGAAVADNIGDVFFNKKVLVSLVSNEFDTETGTPQRTEYSEVTNWWAYDGDAIADEFSYEMTFTVPKDFGEAGAILVSNEHHNEFYLKSLVVEFPGGTAEFLCDSWVYPKEKYNNRDRIFFSNKTYLPNETPPGLRALRELEFENLRGDGTGERMVWDRIYDYDVYNDLGDPDDDPQTLRPIAGGPDSLLKYPRRCRTGRPKAKTPGSEKHEGKPNSKSYEFYVPRDEHFEREKSSSYYATLLKGVAHNLVPALRHYVDDTPNEFDSFAEIHSLYEEGVILDRYTDRDRSDDKRDGAVFLDFLFQGDGDNKHILRYPTPDIIAHDKSAWRHDDEFARQFLAGFNPLVIRAVEHFPPKSILDPKEYPNATNLEDKDILPFLEGMSVKQAIADNRLYTVDYRDVFLPYVNKCEAAEKSTKMYAGRAIFFLNSKGLLKPVAIELSRPPATPGGPCLNEVFTPPRTSAGEKEYRWELAKLHVSSLDFGFHELVSHWGHTHAVVEPFIISTHRNISSVHPIHALLSPLFKNTMYINAQARQSLIASKGLIENTFFCGPYTAELSALAYTLLWRFDTSALPEDLLARFERFPNCGFGSGMAEPDDTQPGNVRLLLNDYPFAQDGLELWEILKGWVTDYVNIVYNSDSEVREDREIQAWWHEIVNVGHADKKDEPWWPKADSRANLIEIISTLAWITGPHHAAVNFGQYAYAGFMPNRPTRLRRLVPKVGSKEHKELLADPDKFFLRTLPNMISTMTLMATVELLSHHSADEEYQGTRLNDLWTSHPKIKAAYRKYCDKLETLKLSIRRRNADPNLPHRHGPSKVQYTLLYPHSTTGITGQGVPLSISI